MVSTSVNRLTVPLSGHHVNRLSSANLLLFMLPCYIISNYTMSIPVLIIVNRLSYIMLIIQYTGVEASWLFE
jgi:hypothetical protein